jgi:serine O-acetyltransferase
VGAWKRLGADLARYYAYQRNPRSALQRLKTILSTEAVWAIVWFRFGQYLEHEAPLVVRVLGLVPYKLMARLLQMAVGIHLDPKCEIGPGIYIGHYGGIWISPYVTIGAHCNISHQVTIGVLILSRAEAPVLGDRVWVGPNATITGRVRVGSGAVVGANSLVVADVPENGVALGVPARIMSYSGSANLLK